ncbi:MAG: hypothetical protein M5T61_18610 [Acidimicrobiia bacterium]|nr:hypothetical protein [Acidimicrobiia bacterium]
MGDPLDVSPDAALTLVSGPDPQDLPGPDGLTLAPGEEVSFDYEFEAAQPGAFSVSSSVTGTDAASRLIGPVEAERNGQVGALEVSVTADPDTVALRGEGGRVRARAPGRDRDGGGHQPVRHPGRRRDAAWRSPSSSRTSSRHWATRRSRTS